MLLLFLKTKKLIIKFKHKTFKKIIKIFISYKFLYKKLVFSFAKAY